MTRSTTLRNPTRQRQPDGTLVYSAIASDLFTLKVGAPTIGLPSGGCDPGAVATIASATASAMLRYRLYGHAPSGDDSSPALIPVLRGVEGQRTVVVKAELLAPSASPRAYDFTLLTESRREQFIE